MGVPDGIGRAGGLRGGPEPRARAGAAARRRASPHRRALPQGLGRPAVLEAGARPWRSGRASCRRRPSASIKRRDIVAELQSGADAASRRAAGAAPRREAGRRLVAGHRRRRSAGAARAEVHLRSRVDAAGLRQPDVHRAGRRLESAGVRAARARRLHGGADVAELLRDGARTGGRRRGERRRRGSAARRCGRGRHRTSPTPVARAGQGGPGLDAAAVLPARARHRGEGRQPHPPAHELHGGGQPRLAPGHGRGQGGAGRGRARIWRRWRRRTTSSRNKLPPGLLRATSPTWCRWSARARSASRWRRPSRCCGAGGAWWCSPRGPAR